MKKMIKKGGIWTGMALLCLPAVAAAKITGQCVDCHTMHNSFEGAAAAIAVGDNTTTPNNVLLKADCIGCHANPDATASIHVMGSSQVPQVYHGTVYNNVNDVDLAAGNFAYISGGKTSSQAGSASGDRKGHNVVDFAGINKDVAFDAISYAPGMWNATGTHADFAGAGTLVSADNLTCAGTNGCHGIRNQLAAGEVPGGVRKKGLPAVRGAHHLNNDDRNTASPVKSTGVDLPNSYRFLMGVMGIENTGSRWQNAGATDHNEYYGSTTQINAPAVCTGCHINGESTNTTTYVKSGNGSMSGLCATCHGYFHISQGGDPTTTGNSAAWIRHPSDYALPNAEEYASYTVFSTTAPVARPDLNSLPATSDTVRPGTDMVMCLSCHQAHATPYDSMLRFDYLKMSAGNAAVEDQNTGCFACHRRKDTGT